TAQPQRVERIHVVGVARRARKRDRITRVHLVLHVATRDVPALGVTDQDDAATFVRVLRDRLPLEGGELVGGDQHAPPARAGMIATSSPSFRGVLNPSMASLFT